MNLTKNCKIIVAGSPVVAADDTDANSSRIDTFGFRGVTFIATITDSVATGEATVTVEQNSIDSDTGMAALAGATATATCAVNDDLNGQSLIIEVECPTERYVQLVRTSATAAIAFGDVIAILDDPTNRPVTEDSTVLDSALVAAPAEA